MPARPGVVGGEDDAEAVFEQVRRMWNRETRPRDELPTADASTILAAWLQQNDSEGSETLIPLEEGDEKSLESARTRLAAALSERRGAATH